MQALLEGAGLQGRRGDEGDVLMSQVEERLHDPPGAGLVVRADEACLDPGHAPVQNDDRGLAQDEPEQAGVVARAVDGLHDQARKAAVAQIVDDGALVLQVAPRDAQDEVVSLLRAGVLDALEHLRAERVGKVRDHQADLPPRRRVRTGHLAPYRPGGDEGALPLDARDHTVAHEHLHGVAHRDAADSKGLAELLFRGKPVPAPELAAADLAQQVAVDCTIHILFAHRLHQPDQSMFTISAAIGSVKFLHRPQFGVRSARSGKSV